VGSSRKGAGMEESGIINTKERMKWVDTSLESGTASKKKY